MKDRKLLENPGDAAHFRWVFARFIEIGSGTELARELAERGVTTASGHRIDKKFIYRMLNNRVYIGDAVYKGTNYPGEHKAIIDREIWDKVHSILTESPRKRAASMCCRATGVGLLVDRHGGGSENSLGDCFPDDGA